ncbi:MAG: hypothetical protein V1815_01240 [Candidatus Woesearchaeota archaeon]
MRELDHMCEVCTENDLVLRILLEETKHKILPVNDRGKMIFNLKDIDFELISDLVKHAYSNQQKNYEKELNTLLKLYLQIKSLEKESLLIYSH